MLRSLETASGFVLSAAYGECVLGDKIIPSYSLFNSKFCELTLFEISFIFIPRTLQLFLFCEFVYWFFFLKRIAYSATILQPFWDYDVCRCLDGGGCWVFWFFL